MVDGRKKLHRTLMVKVLKEFSGAIRSLIPLRAQIEKMGIERQPVVAFAPASVAAKSFNHLWLKLQETVLPTSIA